MKKGIHFYFLGFCYERLFAIICPIYGRRDRGKRKMGKIPQGGGESTFIR